MFDNERFPKLVTTIGEGYVQSRECQYFVGVANKVTVKGDETSVICFDNPPDSGVDVYINGGEYVNFSEAPVNIRVGSFTSVRGSLQESEKILPGNLGCRNRMPNARIYSGDIMEVECPNICREFVLGPVTSQVIGTGGSLILPPGTNRVYIINSIESNNMSVVTINFEWWEEKSGDGSQKIC